MRDLLVAFIVFGSLPFIVKRPFWGIVMLAGLGYMNPHRLCYTFMFDMPVVMIVALATLIGMLNSKEAKRMVWSREIVVLVFFVLWMAVTTTQAVRPQLAWLQFEKVVKIQILTVMTLLLLTSRERVHILIWVIVLSLGFYGIKGGIFTVVNGGVYRVQGPLGTFIGGNNELALALVMTIPLMRYLQLHEQNRLIRMGMSACILLTVLATVGSQSRGALVGLVVTGAIFWIKSRRKLATAVLMAIAGFVVVSTMPSAWFERMHTIETYEEDASAQGRLRAWQFAIDVANERPLGGGFEVFAGKTDAHSIYFEILGEHGWVGLGIFLTLLSFTWLRCGTIIRQAKKRSDMLWARDLAAMIQVSLVGYMSAGAFLGLAYFDYIYHLIAVTAVLQYLVNAEPSKAPVAAAQPERLSLFASLKQA